MRLKDEILITLSRKEWKGGNEIREEIHKRSGRKPSIGSLYVALERLGEEGLIGSLWGYDPEKMKGRGGMRYREFRLSEAGEHQLDRGGNGVKSK